MSERHAHDSKKKTQWPGYVWDRTLYTNQVLGKMDWR